MLRSAICHLLRDCPRRVRPGLRRCGFRSWKACACWPLPKKRPHRTSPERRSQVAPGLGDQNRRRRWPDPHHRNNRIRYLKRRTLLTVRRKPRQAVLLGGNGCKTSQMVAGARFGTYFRPRGCSRWLVGPARRAGGTGVARRFWAIGSCSRNIDLVFGLSSVARQASINRERIRRADSEASRLNT